MSKEKWSFKSADGKTMIQAKTWKPEGDIKGIVQIVHGMVEFIDRYEGFANFLADAGYLVVGHDQLAHGDSVISRKDWGHLPFGDGRRFLLADIDTIRRTIRSEYPGVPYFLLGHSMGSFEVRSYIAKEGAGLAGTIISGTGNVPAGTSAAGNKLAHIIGGIKGQTGYSKLLNNLSIGSYNKKFEPARTPFDWLTRDEAIVDAYAADPRDTFMFTIGGFENLTALTKEVAEPAAFESVPKDLPILIASGGQDPVGDFGKAPVAVAKGYKAAGVKDVTCKVYEEDRHEILNELDKDQVMADILAWIEERVKA